jgi:hypothetical protein
MMCDTNFLQEGKQFESTVKNVLHDFNGKITTMTCFFEVDNTIKLSNLIELSKLPEWQAVCEEVGKPFQVRVPGERKNSRRQHRSFYNSISIIYKEDKRTVCAKVFRTGLHVTGCKTFEKSYEAFDSVCYLIWVLQNVMLNAKAFSNGPRSSVMVDLQCPSAQQSNSHQAAICGLHHRSRRICCLFHCYNIAHEVIWRAGLSGQRQASISARRCHRARTGIR